jgi:hypothetical protein
MFPMVLRYTLLVVEITEPQANGEMIPLKDFEKHVVDFLEMEMAQIK